MRADVHHHVGGEGCADTCFFFTDRRRSKCRTVRVLCDGRCMAHCTGQTHDFHDLRRCIIFFSACTVGPEKRGPAAAGAPKAGTLPLHLSSRMGASALWGRADMQGRATIVCVWSCTEALRAWQRAISFFHLVGRAAASCAASRVSSATCAARGG